MTTDDPRPVIAWPLKKIDLRRYPHKIDMAKIKLPLLPTDRLLPDHKPRERTDA